MERKLATVLFVDLVDSTSLVSASDPEVVRRRVTRFFDQVSRCIETYGGTVEKFAGDAVMAAFGVPQAHEDDSERAVRAALEILDSVRDLGLQARIGIEAGEVVTGAGDSTFATGEALNLAARLQQLAEPGQILIGPAAHRLTLGRVEVEDIGPVQVRGREDPVWVWAATAAGARPAGRVPVTPLVGRDHELDLLENTFARAQRDRRAHLVTIYGEPGVGKSRLANEFLAALEGTTVLHGRCLPYGESITYWPLAEMVKGAADIADDDPLDVAIEKLRECCPAEAVADLLGLATGVLEAVHGERSQQEISWAAREWAQLMSQTQPLILVFEDIHWAEEPLLELIEHMTEWVRDGALMILCLARAELLDVRSNWGGGRVRATAIELEPLGDADGETLIDALNEDGAISAKTRRALLDKTGGNPLFLEEVMLNVAECGEERAVEEIPDTVQALIAARIDRLQPASKSVLQRASVIGRSFWAGAVEYLAEGEDPSDAIEDLLLRDLVVGESRSTLKNETAYRFKHVLIRDVAYASLTKSARAKHHARFAEWLRERAGDELLEIRAHHLDHAASLLAELDGAPPADLAREAADDARGGRPARARPRGQPGGPPPLPALGRARADAESALHGREGCVAPRRPSRRRARDAERVRRVGPRRRPEGRGQGTDGARRRRVDARSRSGARTRAGDAGPRDHRRRPGRRGSMRSGLPGSPPTGSASSARRRAISRNSWSSRARPEGRTSRAWPSSPARTRSPRGSIWRGRPKSSSVRGTSLRRAARSTRSAASS